MVLQYGSGGQYSAGARGGNDGNDGGSRDGRCGDTGSGDEKGRCAAGVTPDVSSVVTSRRSLLGGGNARHARHARHARVARVPAVIVSEDTDPPEALCYCAGCSSLD